ncbi:MAG: SDR family oxidoreductase [Bacteroidota bacterium]|nr:SDR family oxidoreductase [Bacteroidota bacterium]
MNIVITGASKGIGKALAMKFATPENNIFITARNENELSNTTKELIEKSHNANIKYFAADLSDKDSSAKFSTWLTEQNVTPDILINNAGQFIPGSIYNEPDGALEKMLAANLYSAYYLTRALLPFMMDKKSGHIFNMSSIASLSAYNNGGSYSISKFALTGFSKNLREELKPYQIKVTTVYPGAVFTSSWEGSGIEPSRIMEVADVVEMIFAASKLSPQACVEDIIIRPQLGDLP